MNCPVDGSELRMTERQGIEIDYCPQCRGIWLDRGELDKVLERSAQPAYRDERSNLHHRRTGTSAVGTTIARIGARTTAGRARAARSSKICSILVDPVPVPSRER